MLNLRADDVPDFPPAFATSLPEGARVSLRTHSLTVGIIIELNEFRTPPNEHGMLGVEQQSYGRPKTLRPGFRRADRRRLPIMSAHERAHFAPAREESQPLATLPRPW
jgi:hypothetical protein